MAAEWLTPLPSMLIQNGAPVESLHAVMTSLWQEFARPKLQKSPSPEGILSGNPWRRSTTACVLKLTKPF